MKEYCNPINIDYKFQHYGKYAHREAADPTLIYFKGMYYMFASMSAGFYYSKDMIQWEWHENRDLDMYRYAPDVRQIDDYLYFSASERGKPSAFWRTKNPLDDRFEKVSEPFDFWDPNLFYDDDGRVYFFWGCSNSTPLYGIEMDKKTMTPLGEKKAVIFENKDQHGWERFIIPGQVDDGLGRQKQSLFLKVVMHFMNKKGTPYMEGAFLNKWNGKYYLQYAAPGTETPVYGDGVYIADHPLGPYRFMNNTPFSLKPSGFITGAGHGSTIEDAHDNLWHASTMRISVNANYERRVGIFPSGLDEDGYLYCNQNFADYPIVVPDGKFDARTIAPKYMLLSYKKKAKASSTKKDYHTDMALDENIRTWWSAEGSEGEWYELDLGKEYKVHSIQLNLADEEVPVGKYSKEERAASIAVGNRYTDSGTDLYTRYVLEGSRDGQNWECIKDASKTETNLPHDYIVLPEDRAYRYLKLTAVSLPYKSCLAISGFRVFGLDEGEKPAPAGKAMVRMEDAMTARLQWKPVEGAMGYNVRFGIGEDKLYNSFLVYEKNEVLLTTLNAGVDYWYAIDSFNESGLTEGNVFQLEE